MVYATSTHNNPLPSQSDAFTKDASTARRVPPRSSNATRGDRRSSPGPYHYKEPLSKRLRSISPYLSDRRRQYPDPITPSLRTQKRDVDELDYGLPSPPMEHGRYNKDDRRSRSSKMTRDTRFPRLEEHWATQREYDDNTFSEERLERDHNVRHDYSGRDARVLEPYHASAPRYSLTPSTALSYPRTPTRLPSEQNEYRFSEYLPRSSSRSHYCDSDSHNSQLHLHHRNERAAEEQSAIRGSRYLDYDERISHRDRWGPTFYREFDSFPERAYHRRSSTGHKRHHGSDVVHTDMVNSTRQIQGANFETLPSSNSSVGQSKGQTFFPSHNVDVKPSALATKYPSPTPSFPLSAPSSVTMIESQNESTKLATYPANKHDACSQTEPIALPTVFEHLNLPLGVDLFDLPDDPNDLIFRLKSGVHSPRVFFMLATEYKRTHRLAAAENIALAGLERMSSDLSPQFTYQGR